jgi:RHS repeat-associated protein
VVATRRVNTAATDTVRYTPFGADRTATGSLAADRRFAGMRWEPALGLYRAGPRLYDPAIGQFLQPDPVALADPFDLQVRHPYAYARGNPLRYADGSGMVPVSIDGEGKERPSWEKYDAGNACISRGSSPLFDPIFTGEVVNARCLETPIGLRAGVRASGPPYWLDAPLFAANPEPPGGGAGGDEQTTQGGELKEKAGYVRKYRHWVEFQGRRVYQIAIDWTRIDRNGLTNVERARRGQPPIGDDLQAVNLHHILQQEPGPMAEVSASVHQRGQGPLHRLRAEGTFREDALLTKQADAFKRAYWRWRVQNR